jgi:steroid delta-isomerase
MNAFVPKTFTRDWIAAWNRSDVDAVLNHYAEDAIFVSPLAATVTGNPEVRGKDALRAYWIKALKTVSCKLRFSLESFIWDESNQALLIVYISTEPERRVRKCEMMHFNSKLLIDRGEAFVGAVL